MSSTAAEIAKQVRADIKAATKDAQEGSPFAGVPAGVTYSVRSAYFSGGCSVDVTVKNIPVDWGWTAGRGERHPSDALRALAPNCGASRTSTTTTSATTATTAA